MNLAPLMPNDPLSAAERAAELLRLVTGGRHNTDEIKESDREFEREHTTIDVEQSDAYGKQTRVHAERTVTRVSLRHTEEPSGEHEHREQRIADRSRSK